MELVQLKYFCDVAETQHMTRSAQRLHVAQPALSQSMHRLEGELGVTLFERVGRNIRLTPEGAYLNARLQPLLDNLDDAIGVVRAFHEDRVPVLRVGIYAASSIVVDAIAEFLNRESGVSFEVTQEETCSSCDVSVRTAFPGLTGGGRPQLTTIATCTESIGVALPANGYRGSTVNLEDLQGERFISLAGSRGFRHLCDRLCAQRGFFPRSTFESDSPAMVRKMIASGLGIGFWPECSWGPVESEQVRWVPLRDADFVRTVSVEQASFSDELRKDWTERFSAHLVKRIETAFGVIER